MGHWHPHFVRADRPDEIRRWANLEGKSATTRDDLYQQHAEHPPTDRNGTSLIVILPELFATALHALWYTCRR